MICYRRWYELRRSAERNRDFIEHVVLGVCLLIALSLLLGWF